MHGCARGPPPEGRWDGRSNPPLVVEVVVVVIEEVIVEVGVEVVAFVELEQIELQLCDQMHVNIVHCI